MKMVKSLLLGSAGVLAVTAAQAADLPVKAKPVEYVKVCSLYGAGFYYIPGTDTCLKLGGYVRSEWLHNAGGSFAPNNAATDIAQGASTRFTLTDNNDLISRVRAVWSIDTRSQTEYGTLRSYLKVGIQWTTGDAITAGSGATAYWERAFIQFAGFTFGGAQSFFDFFPYAVYSYQTAAIGSDTGGSSINLLAYTAQLGNGVTATLSLEDQLRRRKALVDVSGNVNVFNAGFNVGGAGVTATGYALPFDNTRGQSFPDIVGALRVDQAWGSAQIMGAAHQLDVGYYAVSNIPAFTCVGNTNTCGHPDRDWGWAAGAGLELNLPTGPGDKFSVAATWASGALGYVFPAGIQVLSGFASGGSNGVYAGTFAYVPIADGIYSSTGSTGSVETVDGWSIYAGLKHSWSPNLFSTLYGGYAETSWSGAANSLYCYGTTSPSAAAIAAAPNCNADGSYLQIGSLTQWEPAKNFTMGLEVMYNKIGTSNIGYGGSAGSPASNVINLGNVTGARPNGVYKVDDIDFWSGVLRFQRNFWP